MCSKDQEEFTTVCGEHFKVRIMQKKTIVKAGIYIYLDQQQIAHNRTLRKESFMV